MEKSPPYIVRLWDDIKKYLRVITNIYVPHKRNVWRGERHRYIVNCKFIVDELKLLRYLIIKISNVCFTPSVVLLFVII